LHAPSDKSRHETDALDAYVKLLRASDTLLAAVTPALLAAGLTPAQFGCLEAIYHLGPLCPRAIGRKLLRSPGNMTTVLDNLEKAGLVCRERDTKDRRYVTVRLTPGGRSLIRQVFPRHARQVASLFSALTPAETRQLARICRKLGLASASHIVPKPSAGTATAPDS
jgi:MarR family 2-MHQ and catechol resistance regulon transcriptional repressor